MTVLDTRATAPDSAAAPALAAAARLRAVRRARHRRTALVCAALAVLLVAFTAAALLIDLNGVPASEVLPAALGLREGLADYLVFQLRMPRTLAALLAGALFGLAGALYQRLIRNPLATPDIVGISAGASAGAATVLLLAPAAYVVGAPVAAIAGSFVLVAAVQALSWRGGQVDTYRLILVGIGLSAVCVAYTNYLFTMAEANDLAIAMRWTIGSTNAADWDGVTTLATGLACCLPLAVWLNRSLTAMALGDQLATGLGTRVNPARVAVLLLGAAAAALATSVVGPIGFVSLISGPIAVWLVGAERSVLLAAPVGAAIVIGADVLALHAPLISPVPTGVLTALLGAPYFVWLILRRGQGAS
ncbi:MULTISPECIES: iron ABC transporter permease [Streptomyces]|uniref:Iron ABC transporter permease n=1 Tax=Streptomyces lichenis TaxID=2306967 RepID=A0ABT0IAA5_9ACTN|nr:iron ABC transporter permease [Streptomyces lichenis]MCK8678260.1 iron ABC transporter permease [Streptomyces lichenis]